MPKKNYDAAGKRLRKNGGPWRGKSAKRELPAEELTSYQRLIFGALEVGLEGSKTDFVWDKEEGFPFRRTILFESGVSAVVSVRLFPTTAKAEPKAPEKDREAEELDDPEHESFSELLENSFKAGKHSDHICVGPGCIFCLRKIRAAEE